MQPEDGGRAGHLLPAEGRLGTARLFRFPARQGGDARRRGHHQSDTRGILELLCAAGYTSQRDQLNDLFNRYSLEVNFDRLWNLLLLRMRETVDEHDEYRRHTPHTYWLGVLDVDHFKAINDKLGHMIIDEVLIIVARLLKK